MHSRIVAIVGTVAIVLLGSAGAMAQDATPEASPGGESLFAELGLPELTVTATNEGFEVSESEVEAGRYLVHLVNETDNPDIAAGFVRLVDGKTLDDLSFAEEMASGTPMPEEMPDVETFAWLYDTYVAGGVTTDSDQGVIDLRGGEYGVWADNPTSPIAAAPLTVTGDADARIEGPEPEAAVTIVEEGAGGEGFKFTVTGEVLAGPQIVKILNASDQPHFVITFHYPEEITIEQVMEFLMFDPSSGATPSAAMLDETLLTFPMYAPTQSVGTTQWVELDAEPGQLIIVCFVPDPVADGIPHAFEGMVSLLPVAES
ncbi:MAG: hypothetical protein K0R44_1686 [Thermomicrobiales bacterium]|jgi:hypothetical protein|nr:hypothetical protein [Thermomicrobiales bacterium]